MMTDTAGKPVSTSDPFNVWMGLDVKEDGIPFSLKCIDQWLLWKAEPRPEGKGTNKIPYQGNGKKASSTNPETWSDFSSVTASLFDEDSEFSGAGFVVRAENGITVLDFDHVRNAYTGEIDETVLGAVRYLGTYAEVSPSGTGIRIIGYGTMDRAISSKTLQGWVTGRYVTITGHHVEGTNTELQPIDPLKLAEVVAWFADKQASSATTQASNSPTGYLLDTRQVLEIRQALGYVDPDESYDIWVQVGMALQSTGTDNAFGLWNEWSQVGPKYNSAIMRAKWASFCDKPGGVSLPTIFKLAQDRGWVNTSSGVALGFSQVAIKPVTNPTSTIYHPSSQTEFPEHLILQAPGKIGEILAWGLRTAHKPQPQLALQAAIVAAMAPMARRYRTNLNNWPMLWMLGMAVTAAGKEHGKTMVEEILSAARLDQMVGGSGYTSPGAVFSSLMDHPAHIALVDEFGKLMESSQAFGNQIKADAITMLMEIFGRGHGVVRPASYSFMSLTKEQRETLQSRKIHNPAILILAMTTPGTFYSSLSQKWIADGFLGRFLTCESSIGRAPSVYPESEDVPDTITQWALETALASTIGGIVTHIPIPSDTKPEPITLKFSPAATASIRAFEADVIARMNHVQRDGLEVLLGRTVEKAMRLSMATCLAEGADRRTISDTDFQWAKEYALACDSLMVEKAKENISDSEFGRVKNRCIDLLRAAGSKGLTFRELGKKSSAFDALKPREQKEVMEALSVSGAAELREIATMANRGRKRTAWVALADDQEDDSNAQTE